MPFQVSPGVNTSEIDLTTIVPGISSIDAGLAGPFRWGPVNDITLIDSEALLESTFQSPDANTYSTFFTAANFLQYSNRLHVVRSTSSAQKNASATGTVVLTANSSIYYNTYSESDGTPVTAQGDWQAKYAGELGNSLKVSLCMPTRANLVSGNTTINAQNTDTTISGTVAVATSNAITGTSTYFGVDLRVGDAVIINSLYYVIGAITSNTAATVTAAPAVAVDASNTIIRMKRSGFEEPARNMLGTCNVTANSTTITGGANTTFTYQFNTGDIVKINGEERRVNAITNSTIMVTDSPFNNTATAQTYSRTWEYRGSADWSGDPVTTAHSARRGANYDEVHIAVVDEEGTWTGTKGQVLETYNGVSVAKGARYEDGTSAYYVDAINRRSKKVWWMDHDTIGDAYTTGGADVVAWGTSANSNIFQANGHVKTVSLSGGVDGSDSTDGNKMTAYGKFKNTEETEIGLLLGGESSATVALELISICEQRKDCVAFLSPDKTDVVNQEASEVANVIDFRNQLGSSSYAFLDSGWMYQYDKYNDTYRYVPLNGAVGGVTAATEASRDAWYSPAGFTRGNIRNVSKLPFNPRQSERDDLYKNGINPVVTFAGEGTILFGDKTLLAKPSAFDRINVRRLFIILEKSISRFARSQLFEFNDAFTRTQFTSTVTPFLRSVRARNGITAFRVVCDNSNNTSDVVDRNEFVGDIYVKPNRSINFIQLNFVAVRSGVEFSEITGG